MPAARPVFLLAALAGLTPSVAFADTGPVTGVPLALGLPHDASPGSIMIAIAAVALLGIVLLLATGRINWRLGAIMVVACGALFGGDAIVEGAQTAIAVTQ